MENQRNNTQEALHLSRTKLRPTRVTTFNDMPYEILVQIFMYLNIVDLVICVSGVSRLWREACCDPKLWKVFNLDVRKSHWFVGRRNPLLGLDQESSITQIRFLERALKLSGEAVNSLVFSSVIFLRSEHLLYLAERSPKLKQLVILRSWNLLDMVGFSKAVMMYWTNLESLTIPCFYYPSSMMKVISLHCKNFSTLKIKCPLDLEFAKAIVQDIPRLKVLTLQYTVYYSDGLAHLLKTSKHLEVLNLSHSQLVDHLLCAPRNFQTIELEKEIVEKASQLKNLITCRCLLSKYRCNCAYNDKDF